MIWQKENLDPLVYDYSTLSWKRKWMMMTGMKMRKTITTMISCGLVMGPLRPREWAN
jgi:hypothetical protein